MMRHLRQDLPASLSVFFVALPLCLGIAVASGAEPVTGLIAGIVGGIVVGALSGSTIGVSGPAAGLTSIVLLATQTLGSFGAVLMAVMLAGAMQVALGFLRAGVIAYYFPSAVIKGMLAGIGIIIVLKQLPHLVGHDTDPIGEAEFIQPDQHNTISELYYMLQNTLPGALVIALVCLALLLLWDRRFVQNQKFLRMIPGSFLAVVVGVALARIFEQVPSLSIGPQHYVDLPQIEGFHTLPRPDFGAIAHFATWTTAFTLAIVASLETLLCVEASDRLDPAHTITPTNRELHAQGVGNLVSGFLGGLPVTQVVVRTSANVQAGAKSKTSTIVHGVLLLIAVLLVPHWLRLIPLAALAALLLLVGYKLVKPSQWASIWRSGKMQFIPFVVTVLGVAFTDLLTGVLLGLSVAVVHILWKNYKAPFQYDPRRTKPGMPIYMELSQDVTFLNKASIMRTLNELPNDSRVVIDASRTNDIDPDVLEIIEDFASSAPDRGIQVELIDFPHDGDALEQMTLLGGRSPSR